MPFNVVESTDPLVELERRQDEVLRQLDELDLRIEEALSTFAAVQKETAELFGRRQKAAA
jgi:CII-binding regulator of phage lambda lysogenization HflD